jgi:hypothetical protein
VNSEQSAASFLTIAIANTKAITKAVSSEQSAASFLTIERVAEVGAGLGEWLPGAPSKKQKKGRSYQIWANAVILLT